MASCHDMKKGEIYTCPDCEIELKVIRECTDSGADASDCGCHDDDEPCGFNCCGKPLVRKS